MVLQQENTIWVICLALSRSIKKEIVCTTRNIFTKFIDAVKGYDSVPLQLLCKMLNLTSLNRNAEKTLCIEYHKDKKWAKIYLKAL